MKATLAIGYTFDDLAFTLTGRYNTTPNARNTYAFSQTYDTIHNVARKTQDRKPIFVITSTFEHTLGVMNGRRAHYVGMTLGGMLLLALLLLWIAAAVPYIPRSWWYWSYMRQAESYVSEIEKFKTQHGYYPDARLQRC